MHGTQAIILEKYPLREADEIISLYTKEYGLLRVKARGIKKPGAKLAGSTQSFSYLTVFFVLGHDLPVLTETQTIDTFSNLKKNAGAIVAAEKAAHIISRVIPESSVQESSAHDHEYWEMVLEYFRTLESMSTGADWNFMACVFAYKSLVIGGSEPQLERCSLCGSSLAPGPQLFSPRLGGVLDRSCGRRDPDGLVLTHNARMALNTWRNNTYEQVVASVQDQEDKKTVISAVDRFISWHFGTQLMHETAPVFV